MITKEPVPIRGFGLTLFRVWQYAVAPAMVIPGIGMIGQFNPTWWVWALSVLIGVAFIAFFWWAIRRKEIEHGYKNVSGFAALAAFLIGLCLWSLMMYVGLKSNKMTFDKILSTNMFLVWPVLLVGPRPNENKRL